MKNILFTLFIYIIGTPLLAQDAELLMFLNNHEDIDVQPCLTPDGYVVAYTLFIEQPIDHLDPSSGTFKQKVFLSHLDKDSSMVLVTEGYNRGVNRMYELSSLIGANQLDIEHRFYGDSKPNNLDWQYLTIQQAAADYHRIRDLFAAFYNGSWLATGISKGGQTAICYRYLYPDDVKATVPYVAPLNLSLEEKRIYTFLDNVGTSSCRKKIRAIQQRLLDNKNEVMTYLEFYAKGAGLTFDYHENRLEAAMEYAILEYPFSFWQWGHSCEDIPSAKSSIKDLTNYLLEVSGIDFFSDKDIAYYEGHYYQCGAQYGYYGYDPTPFGDKISAINWDEENFPSAIFMPEGTTITFNPRFVQEVYDWTQTEANQFIYINGANDTWSATSVPVSDKVDALWFNMEGQSHGTARIANMSEKEKATLLRALTHWLNN
ncbi:MAG: S28 family serine protease [Flavobacteriales bacterium]|nr:S28 family serine protease [Flavobacteriales bacterium]MDG2247193.1 S28 family serine protease [Flavobacteriales bacterium]